MKELHLNELLIKLLLMDTILNLSVKYLARIYRNSLQILQNTNRFLLVFRNSKIIVSYRKETRKEPKKILFQRSIFLIERGFPLRDLQPIFPNPYQKRMQLFLSNCIEINIHQKISEDSSLYMVCLSMKVSSISRIAICRNCVRKKSSYLEVRKQNSSFKQHVNPRESESLRSGGITKIFIHCYKKNLDE